MNNSAFNRRSLSRILFGVYLFPLLLVLCSLSTPPDDLPLCGLMLALAVVGLILARDESRIWRILWISALAASVLFGVLEIVAGKRLAHQRADFEPGVGRKILIVCSGETEVTR